MKSTWFGQRSRYDFARCVCEADYGRMDFDLFRSFLVCTHAAFMQACNRLHGSIDSEIESAFEQEIKKCKNATKFSEALGILTEALEEEPYDFLGYVMMELGLGNNQAGQCFTPRDVSRAMAEMILMDANPEAGRTLKLQEPACGGGSMIIEASQVLKSKGFYPWHYCWWATDVDWKCYAMTFIQTTLLGIPAVVTCGNSLTLEQFTTSANLICLLHPPKRERNTDGYPERTEKEKCCQENQPRSTQRQLFCK